LFFFDAFFDGLLALGVTALGGGRAPYSSIDTSDTSTLGEEDSLDPPALQFDGGGRAPYSLSGKNGRSDEDFKWSGGADEEIAFEDPLSGFSSGDCPGDCPGSDTGIYP